MNYDYEYLAWKHTNMQNRVPQVLESYSGTSIVQWAGDIERNLSRMVEETEDTNNFVYADKLRKILTIWRENQITGSKNVETINTLLSIIELAAVDHWTYQNFFSNLRDQLRKLKASEEEFPTVEMGGNDELKGPGAGASSPPMSTSFGGEEEPPTPGKPENEPENTEEPAPEEGKEEVPEEPEQAPAQ